MNVCSKRYVAARIHIEYCKNADTKVCLQPN